MQGVIFNVSSNFDYVVMENLKDCMHIRIDISLVNQ